MWRTAHSWGGATSHITPHSVNTSRQQHLAHMPAMQAVPMHACGTQVQAPADRRREDLARPLSPDGCPCTPHHACVQGCCCNKLGVTLHRVSAHLCPAHAAHVRGTATAVATTETNGCGDRHMHKQQGAQQWARSSAQHSTSWTQHSGLCYDVVCFAAPSRAHTLEPFTLHTSPLLRPILRKTHRHTRTAHRAFPSAAGRGATW